MPNILLSLVMRRKLFQTCVHDWACEQVDGASFIDFIYYAQKAFSARTMYEYWQQQSKQIKSCVGLACAAKTHGTSTCKFH